MRTATASYREECDPVGEFLSTCTVLDPQGHIAAADFFRLYVAWAEHAALPERERLGYKALGMRMGQRFTKKSRKRGAYYCGVSVLPTWASSMSEYSTVATVVDE